MTESNSIPKNELDEVFEILKSQDRRILCLLLLQDEIKNTSDALKNTYWHDKETQISVYHHHLPKLNDAGYITWDKHTDTIQKTDKFTHIKTLYEILQKTSKEPFSTEK